MCGGDLKSIHVQVSLYSFHQFCVLLIMHFFFFDFDLRVIYIKPRKIERVLMCISFHHSSN